MVVFSVSLEQCRLLERDCLGPRESFPFKLRQDITTGGRVNQLFYS